MEGTSKGVRGWDLESPSEEGRICAECSRKPVEGKEGKHSSSHGAAA